MPFCDGDLDPLAACLDMLVLTASCQVCELDLIFNFQKAYSVSLQERRSRTGTAMTDICQAVGSAAELYPVLWALGRAAPAREADVASCSCQYASCVSLTLAPQILDELIISGEMQESSKKSVLRVVSQSDAIEEAENSEDVSAACCLGFLSTADCSPRTQSLARIGSRSG